jgi:dihydroorotase
MPNLIPPVRTTKDGIAYRARIMATTRPSSKL